MHFYPPAFLLILLSAVLMLSAGCMQTIYPRHERGSLPPHTNYYTHGPTLAEVKDKNFSVLRTEMVLKGMSMNNPMYIRAFKSEMQLELWVKSSYGPQYELFKTYSICNKSGVLGPKLKEGDKQTPEGFYDVTPHRLNPNSQYFLSFNIGYPNRYDQSLGRTGSNLMVHGECVSEGCLAMNNYNIAEIYLIVEQNFKYGHSTIPVHIFPFRMTPTNMAFRRFSKWYGFWANLKEAYDYFETYHRPPSIIHGKGRYIIKHDDRYAHNDKKLAEL